LRRRFAHIYRESRLGATVATYAPGTTRFGQYASCVPKVRVPSHSWRESEPGVDKSPGSLASPPPCDDNQNTGVNDGTAPGRA